MHYQEIKEQFLQASIEKLIDIARQKFGSKWACSDAFYSSKERVMLNRYIESLNTINNTLHQVSDHG
jgi:hypothetical protein